MLRACLWRKTTLFRLRCFILTAGASALLGVFPEDRSSAVTVDSCEKRVRDPSAKHGRLGCLRLQSEVAGVVVSGRVASGATADFRLGFVSTPLYRLSLLAGGQYRSFKEFDQEDENQALDILAREEVAFDHLGLRFGSLGRDGFSLYIGEASEGFGIRLRAIESVLSSYSIDWPWVEAVRQARVTLQAQKAYLEASAVESMDGQARAIGRIGYDISALDGTRLLGSIGSLGSGRLRFGFGLINANRAGDQTSIEVVRHQLEQGQLGDYNQMFRLAHLGNWKRGGRWRLVYEQDRLRQRFFALGHDFRVGPVAIKLQIAQRKQDEVKWFFLTGVAYAW